MLVDRQTINCAFAFSCKKFALSELADPMRRGIFTQLFLQGAARLGALQVPKRQLCGNLTSIGRTAVSPLMPERPRRGEDYGVRALAEVQRFCFAASVLRSA